MRASNLCFQQERSATPDLIDDLESRYGSGPFIAQIRQAVKRGGELMATYEMEYPSLREAMCAIAEDLREGRVEAITIAGEPLAAEHLEALKGLAAGLA